MTKGNRSRSTELLRRRKRRRRQHCFFPDPPPVFGIWFLGFVISFFSCSRKNEIPAVSDASGPMQIVTNSTLYLYDGPRKAWMLESKELRKALGEGGSTVGYPVRLTIYDSSGATGTVCLADSGSTNEKKDIFEAWGNVYVKNEEGTVVRAQRLRWEGSRHTVTSDSFVEIRTPSGDIERGKGLDATETFSSWTLRSNVSGHFPNFRERLDAEDAFSLGPSLAAKTRAPASPSDSGMAAEPDRGLPADDAGTTP